MSLCFVGKRAAEEPQDGPNVAAECCGTWPLRPRRRCC